MKKISKLIFWGFMILYANHASGETVYEIQAAVNDEKFIINGEVYEAKTYCFGWEEGDRVIFVEGSPFGACVTATLVNIDRNDVCRVWCE